MITMTMANWVFSAIGVSLFLAGVLCFKTWFEWRRSGKRMA